MTLWTKNVTKIFILTQNLYNVKWGVENCMLFGNGMVSKDFSSNVYHQIRLISLDSSPRCSQISNKLSLFFSSTFSISSHCAYYQLFPSWTVVTRRRRKVFSLRGAFVVQESRIIKLFLRHYEGFLWHFHARIIDLLRFTIPTHRQCLLSFTDPLRLSHEWFIVRKSSSSLSS